jgi:hypothetical protein
VTLRLEHAAQIGDRTIADVVQDDVVALVALGEIVLRVVDHMVRAERAHELDVARAAYAGDISTVVLRELNRKRAHTARRAVDQDLLSGLDLALVAQTL